MLRPRLCGDATRHSKHLRDIVNQTQKSPNEGALVIVK